jgi:hypothetical protein
VTELWDALLARATPVGSTARGALYRLDRATGGAPGDRRGRGAA